MKRLLIMLAMVAAAQTWTGSGSRSIGGITKSRAWKITYGCTNGSGVIGVTVYQGDDIIEVTSSTDGQEQSTDIEKTGTFRLSVTSTCRWKLTVE